jgi:cytosine/adenosine deaminase-related metal-dependent hydrolase
MRMLISAGNRAVAVEHSRIVEAVGPFDLTLSFPEGEVRPGLINAHDHLHRNHYGRLGRPPYRSARDWARDIQFRHRQRIEIARRTPRREALLTGAWKNLFAGVTTVVHHDAWEPDFDRDFPLSVVRVRQADSLGMSPAIDRVEGVGPFCIHLAEGTDGRSADEVRLLDARGMLDRDLIAVHCVGVDTDGIERLALAGAALVWCPTSNLFLFGATAPADLLGAGLDVLLGSDSRLTGAGDLLDELRSARALGLLSDELLEAAVGITAACRLGLAIPSLDPGAPADLMVVARPLLKACAEDVLLVMAGGALRVVRPDLVSELGGLAAGGREMRNGSLVRWTNTGTLQHA